MNCIITRLLQHYNFKIGTDNASIFGAHHSGNVNERSRNSRTTLQNKRYDEDVKAFISIVIDVDGVCGTHTHTNALISEMHCQPLFSLNI